MRCVNTASARLSFKTESGDTTAMSSGLQIRHERPARRFGARLDGLIAYLSYEERGDNVLEYAQVYVPPEQRGRGVAAEITRTALEYARENGYSVIPSCSYVAAFVRRHREYDDILTR